MQICWKISALSLGHIELIKQKLNEGIPALIMVRNIEPDERNPFTTEQTVRMIKKYHAAHGDYNKAMIILILNLLIMVEEKL